ALYDLRPVSVHHRRLVRRRWRGYREAAAPPRSPPPDDGAPRGAKGGLGRGDANPLTIVAQVSLRQCASVGGALGGTTFPSRGTSSVAGTKAIMIARNASAKARVEASR